MPKSPVNALHPARTKASKMKIENKELIKAALIERGFFQEAGVYAVVDGQFGSTGKGLASGLLGELFANDVDLVTSNAGPNSGHTSYFDDEKIVLMQLPSFAATAWNINENLQVYMNAGAIIDIDRLNEEIAMYAPNEESVTVDPQAAVVTKDAKEAEKALVSSVGSTGKGTGAALAGKIMRDPKAVAYYHAIDIGADVSKIYPLHTDVVFMEISQGFSLSINASGMYPFTTSRDCTVAQGISDLGVNPKAYKDCIMVVRTFPIRVAGNSGPCYEDQIEYQWDDLGLEPEITTVTKKVRRVFSWSVIQFQEAVRVNRPSVVFVNFMNYLTDVYPDDNHDVDVNHDEWLDVNVIQPYREIMGCDPVLLLGYGPTNEDVALWVQA